MDLLPALSSNEAVAKAEAFALTLPQVDLQTQHLVHGGMCARTIFIPAGTFLTGALTEMDNVCVMFGDIEVTTDDGPVRLVGFHVLAAKAGAKRAGRTFADTWWTTVWPTKLTEIADIEDEMTREAAKLQTRRLIEHVVNNRIEGGE